MGSSTWLLLLFTLATLEKSVRSDTEAVLTLAYKLSTTGGTNKFIYFDNEAFLRFQECVSNQASTACVVYLNRSSSGVINVTKISQEVNGSNDLTNYFLCNNDVGGNTDEIKCTRRAKGFCGCKQSQLHQYLNFLNQTNACDSGSVYISWSGYNNFGIYSYDEDKLELQQCNCTDETKCTNETTSSYVIHCSVHLTTVPSTVSTSKCVPSTILHVTTSTSVSTTSTRDHFSGNKVGSKTYTLIGAITGAVVLVALVATLVIIVYRKRKGKTQAGNSKSPNHPFQSTREIRNLGNINQMVATVESEAYYSSIDQDNRNRERVNKRQLEDIHGGEIPDSLSYAMDTSIPIDTVFDQVNQGSREHGLNRGRKTGDSCNMSSDYFNTVSVPAGEIHYSIIDQECDGNGFDTDSKTISEKDISNISVDITSAPFVENTYYSIKDDEDNEKGAKTHQENLHDHENTNTCTGKKAVDVSVTSVNNDCAASAYSITNFEKKHPENTYSKLGEKLKNIKNPYDVLKNSKQNLTTGVSLLQLSTSDEERRPRLHAYSVAQSPEHDTGNSITEKSALDLNAKAHKNNQIKDASGSNSHPVTHCEDSRDKIPHTSDPFTPSADAIVDNNDQEYFVLEDLSPY